MEIREVVSSIKNVKTFGWEHAIRGMRKAHRSLDKIDSKFCMFGGVSCFKNGEIIKTFNVGEADLKLIRKLKKAGTSHAKMMRLLIIQFDANFVFKWWKQYNQQKIGTEKVDVDTTELSESTMHNIMDRHLNKGDFDSIRWDDADDKILDDINGYISRYWMAKSENDRTLMNYYEEVVTDKLPSSYLQDRTVQINYQVLYALWETRKLHKLRLWSKFFDELSRAVPYFDELILKEI